MKQIVKTALDRLGYRIQGIRYTPRQLLNADALLSIELDDVLCRRMFEHGPALTFVQVGAFDGVMADPLYRHIGRHGWRGVMIEPQPMPAGRLRQLYAGNENITVLQCAIDRTRGERALYVVEAPPDTAPEWAGGLASFDRQTIEKNSALIPGLAEMIREIAVECKTFDDVLALLPDARLDLLQIDAEGADAYLLSLFPFERLRPAIVHFEVKHLTKSVREDCLALLDRHGYRYALSGGENVLAVRPERPA